MIVNDRSPPPIYLQSAKVNTFFVVKKARERERKTDQHTLNVKKSKLRGYKVHVSFRQIKKDVGEQSGQKKKI